MKRKVMIICLLIISLALCSCKEPIKIEIPVGEKITEDFKVNSYFNNNAIIQANSTISITGVSEEGVVMIASIYDSKGELISQNYGIATLDNTFSIAINTPNASTKNYKLEIKDSFDTFIHTYTNIKFGQVWLINKNVLSVVELPEENKENLLNQNIGYYYVNKTMSSWDNSEIITSYVRNLANKIYQEHKSIISNDIPIGIIVIDTEDTYLFEWISKNKIDRAKFVKDYLIKENLYDNEIVSNLYEKVLSPLEGIKISGYIWHYSEKDASFSLGEDYSLVYSILINFLTNYFCDTFGENIKKVFVQNPTSENEKINELRSHQMIMSYYFSNSYLIPTYDLNVKYDEELEKNFIVEIDQTKLIKRIIDIVFEGKRPSGYSKLVSLYNDKGELTKISIYISNTDKLICKEMNFLNIYDNEGNLIELNYVIKNNVIEIDLEIPVLEEEVVDVQDGNENIEPIEKQYYQISRIEYEALKEKGGNWLYNEENIPVLPFIIEVGK